MNVILEELRENFKALKVSWKTVGAIIVGVTAFQVAVGVAQPAPSRTPSYSNMITVQDGYITRNGRSAKFKFTTSLMATGGTAVPGFCRNFPVTVNVKDLRGTVVSITFRKTVRGCYSGRSYTYTGALDLAPPQREANIFFRFGKNIKFYVSR